MTTFAHEAGSGRPSIHTVHAPPNHREVHAMNSQISYLQTVHADRLARLHAEAQQVRLARPARADARRLRRALGHSLVRAGQLIAAEPSAPERSTERLTPAGSR